MFCLVNPKKCVHTRRSKVCAQNIPKAIKLVHIETKLNNNVKIDAIRITSVDHLFSLTIRVCFWTPVVYSLERQKAQMAIPNGGVTSAIAMMSQRKHVDTKRSHTKGSASWIHHNPSRDGIIWTKICAKSNALWNRTVHICSIKKLSHTQNQSILAKLIQETEFHTKKFQPKQNIGFVLRKAHVNLNHGPMLQHLTLSKMKNIVNKKSKKFNRSMNNCMRIRTKLLCLYKMMMRDRTSSPFVSHNLNALF